MWDYAEIEQALQQFIHTLPEKPKWIVILTKEGEFISRAGEFVNEMLEPPFLTNQAVSLATTNHASQEIQTLENIRHGTFQYSISFGSDGCYIIVHLNDAYLLGISYQWIGIKSLDLTIGQILANYFPLLSVLYKNADH